MRYITDEQGDIVAVERDGEVHAFDPSVWGWDPASLKPVAAEISRPVSALRYLPNVAVIEGPGSRFVPGPRNNRKLTWGSFVDGAAPPAAVRSDNGHGTLAYMGRLSEAVGYVATNLGRTGGLTSPVLISDHVGGRLIRVSYDPPLIRAGEGIVYVIEDGHAIKVGYTAGQLLTHMAGLQTGNPRLLRPIAEIRHATDTLEARLHRGLTPWRLIGEWFAREPLIEAANQAGGFDLWLRKLAARDHLDLVVHPPYR